MAFVSRLHSLRTAIETHWVQHGTVYPGAEGLPQLLEQLMSKTNALGEVGVGLSFVYGPYLRSTKIPDNPLTFLNGIRVVEVMPDVPTGHESWIYSHRTGEIRANSPGSDLGGVRFFDL